MIEKLKNNVVLLLVISIMSVTSLKAQNKNKEELETKLEKIIKETKIPGLQLVHVKDGRVEHYNLGYKNIESKDKVNSYTLFQSASLSKAVMAYAVLKLYDQGILDLDKPLDEYWSYNRLDNEPRRTKMTARMALNHTTGLRNWAKPRGSDLKAYFDPGTDFKYSGEGYLYLQKVIEHLTNKSLEEIAVEEVFEPLQMKASHFIYMDYMEGDFANGHTELEVESLRKFENPNGAFSLITTASDYMEFVQKVLIEGQGLKPISHDMMVGYSSSRSPTTGYGLGVGLQQNEKGNGIFHNGSNPGFRNFFFVYPATGEGVVCFTNGTNGEKARAEIAELFLGEQMFWGF